MRANRPLTGLTFIGITLVTAWFLSPIVADNTLAVAGVILIIGGSVAAVWHLVRRNRSI